MLATLIFYAIVNAAAAYGFVLFCALLGLPVIGVKRFASGERHRPTFDELTISGLGVWVAGWLILLPIYYLDHLLNGDRYISNVLRLVRDSSSWLAWWEAAALTFAAIISYCATLGLLALVTSVLLGCVSGGRKDFGGALGFWLLFGYLGLPLIMAFIPRP